MNAGKQRLILFILGVCTGVCLLWGISAWWDRKGAAQTEAVPPEKKEIAVDYPFSGDEAGWSLVLRESGTEDGQDRFPSEQEFCLYDENGWLLQEFPCDIAAEEMIFRFDVLFDYDKDLVAFTADAQEMGTEGLCYQWEREKQRFAEEPVAIPWYQEGSVREHAFLVSEVESDGGKEDAVTNAICRINEESGSVVQLRRWKLRKDAETGEESLCIQDCLEQKDIYSGRVERNQFGDLKNEKYYQYLFWDGLKYFSSGGDDSTIRITKEVQGKGLINAEYDNKKSFLADYGFAEEEPFYEYYDLFHNLIMELYFNPQTGRGCGIRYYYFYRNDDLEKAAVRDGFAFDEDKVQNVNWEPQDSISTLTVSGKDPRVYHMPGYREIYEYTDDGLLSFFEARGMDEREHEPVEVSLLSMDYVYRNDGTLCHKEYHHDQMIYGTTCQSQTGDYDELGRLVFQYEYITHGAQEFFYIYEAESMEPKYCLYLDCGGGGVDVRMNVFGGKNRLGNRK